VEFRGGFLQHAIMRVFGIEVRTTTSYLAVMAVSTGCSSGSPGSAGDAGSVAASEGGVSGGDGGSLTSGNPTGLWVGGAYAYSASALGVSGTPNPEDECLVPGSGASTAPSAFDGAGNLWAQDAAGANVSVIMWSAAQVAAACSSGPPARAIRLGPQATVDQISSFAFDAQGTLWLSFVDEAVLIGLSSDQLAASGTVSPTYFMQYGGQGAQQLHAPQGLAVDSAGNLWVANGYSVLEYSPATLSAAEVPDGGRASPVADAYLSTAASETAALSQGGGPAAPSFAYVAFDESGNLWVSGSSYGSQPNSDYVAEYAASDLGQLASNNTPAPLVVLLETAQQAANFADFGAIAFDATGNLWVGSNADLFRFPASSFVPTGGAYDVAITGLPALTNRSLAFNPIPAGLPIRP
jgi:hypothetical protein